MSIQTDVSTWVESDTIVSYHISDDPPRPFSVPSLKFGGHVLPTLDGDYHNAAVSIHFYGYSPAEALANVERVIAAATALRDEMVVRIAEQAPTGRGSITAEELAADPVMHRERHGEGCGCLDALSDSDAEYLALTEVVP